MRVLYLHGFASGPGSAKGRAFASYFGQRGIELDCLDLRRPSLAQLRLTAILAEVERAMAGRPAVLIGSSLGGLAAARLAERTELVRGLVLLAPAFRLIERWRRRIGEPAWAAWRATGSLEVLDHTTGRPALVDIGFADDVAAIDAAGDGWPTLRVPTWIAHGQRDDVVDPALSRQMASRHPDLVTLVEVDDDHQLLASVPTLLPAAFAAVRAVVS
ncbi:MAG: alpha/beta fold hydrolase [Kofleriaceae bacterium]|nr:alpha/beta fold hydrolase [Kofleriaceae bacterium]